MTYEIMKKVIDIIHFIMNGNCSSLHGQINSCIEFDVGNTYVGVEWIDRWMFVQYC